MNNELNKALPKRILFFKSQIAAYTRRDGVTVAAHSDKRTKKVAATGDDRTGDLFAQPAPKAEKPRMPLEGHPYHDKSDEELRYIVKDAGETAALQRGMSSEGKYLDQMNDASTVLYHRKQNGIVKPHVVKPIVDMAKKNETTAAKPPEGVYATLDAFEADTQPFGVVANFAAAMSGIRKDWKTHGKTLREILDAMKPATSKDWQHEKEMSDPGFARAYRTAFSESWRIALDIKDMDEANPKLNILDKVRGPWALDLIHRVAEGDKRFSLDNYPNDSKPYAKIKGEKVGELKKIKVTPQVLSDRKAASIISASADSIATLRRADVGRVMDETPVHYRLAMSHHIKEHRKDLADEVDSIMAEEGFAKSLPILFLKSHVKQYTDKNGRVVKEHDDKRVKKMAPMAAGRKPAQQEAPAVKDSDPNDEEGAAHGYGTHNIEEGDSINFKAGDFSGKGKVKSVGKDGATVEDESGRSHSVHWHEVTGFKGAEGTKKPDDQRQTLGPRDPVPADKFNANEWKGAHDDANVSEESVLKAFPEDTAAKIDAAIERLVGIEETQTKFKESSGEYSAERQALHDQILFGEVDGVDEDTGAKIKVPGILAGWKTARPADGEAPTFTILGGRGGSGKSQFKGMVYDPAKCIVLDADHIKSMLPEYEGWNAHQVHEESSDILERALEEARAKGLNVVLDATMKTAKSAIAKVQSFKDGGYRTEAHYMHLPRQEAAKRAVARFLGKTARFVPPKVVLSNTTNEASFDDIKGMVDAWSFRDNNVKKGEEPILISESKKAEGEADKADDKPMQKSIAPAMIVLWRKRS